MENQRPPRIHVHIQGAKDRPSLRASLLFFLAIALLALAVTLVGLHLRDRRRAAIVVAPLTSLQAPPPPTDEKIAPRPGRTVPAEQEFPRQVEAFLALVPTPEQRGALAEELWPLHQELSSLASQERYGEAAALALAQTRSRDKAFLSQPVLALLMAQVLTRAGMIYSGYKTWVPANLCFKAAVLCWPKEGALKRLLWHSEVALNHTDIIYQQGVDLIRKDLADLPVYETMLYESLALSRMQDAHQYGQVILELRPGDPQAQAAVETYQVLRRMGVTQSLDQSLDQTGSVPQAEGFAITCPRKLPSLVTMELNRLLIRTRDTLAQQMAIVAPEPLPVTINPVEIYNDIARSPLGCRPSREGAISLPAQGLHPLITPVGDSIINAVTQATVNRYTNGLAPCWLAHGLGARVEGLLGRPLPRGGLHNFPPLLGPLDIQGDPVNLTDDKRQVFFSQAAAMVDLLMAGRPPADLARCMKQAAAMRWLESFLECMDTDLESLLEDTRATYGGRGEDR